jgi:8-oxo-dGTP pyrophosphatase MutT (NUDIX family)
VSGGQEGGPDSAWSWEDGFAPPLVDIALVKEQCAKLGPARIQPLGPDLPNRMIRLAATLVPIVSLAGEAAVVVTKRSEGLATHKGDWVFPGGGVDARDSSPAHAAIRETAEELGVAPDRLTVIGEIDGYGPINTGHVVHVFIGLLDGLETDPNSAEVADIEFVPLSVLLQRGRHFRHIGWPDGYEPTPNPEVRQMLASSAHAYTYFEIRPGQLLWGPQADILVQLFALLLGESGWSAGARSSSPR